MGVLTIFTPVSAFVAFMVDAPVIGVVLTLVSLMLWRAMLNR